MLRTPRPTQLDAESEVEHDRGERRVPLHDAAVFAPLECDRFRLIEYREQRPTAPRREMLDERTRERLDLLVLDEAHLHPARVLEPRRTEVHAPFPSIDVVDVDVPEVVLRELTGESFEANDRPRPLGPQLLHQLVELAAAVPLRFRAAQQLERHHVGLHSELADEERAEGLGL